MTLQRGARVDDFTFLNPDGSPRTLRSFEGRPLLIVFLRHLA